MILTVNIKQSVAVSGQNAKEWKYKNCVTRIGVMVGVRVTMIAVMVGVRVTMIGVMAGVRVTMIV